MVEAEYANTWIYYGNIFCTISFLIYHPLTMLFLYNFFNGWSWTTITWSVLEYLLSLYSIFLSVSNEKLQVLMLYAQHYVKGFTQIMILLNVALWVQTQYFWIESVELDQERNDFGKVARDLQMWQIVQNVPTLIFLIIFYFFMVDIENHYIANPSEE